MSDEHPDAASTTWAWHIPRTAGAAGLLLVLLLCPLPVGSQDQIWWAFVCAAAVVACGLYILGIAARPRSGGGMAVPTALFCLILLLAVQLLPLPLSWVAGISPRRAELAVQAADALAAPRPTSIALSASTKETRDALLLLVACVAVFVSSSVAFKRAKSLRYFYAAVAIVGGVMSAWGLLLLVGEGVAVRLRSTYTNPNRLAMLLGICLLCGIGWRLLADRVGRKRERTTATVLSVLCGVALAGTLSRMGIASMALALLLLAFLALRRREREENAHDPRARRLLVVGASIAISSVLASLLASFDPVWNRYSILFDSDFSGNGRAVCWATSLGIARDFPVFGSGAGSFQHVFPLYQQAGELSGWYKYAHNEYVNALADVGVAGLLLVLTAMALWYRAAAKGLGRSSSTARIASWLGIGAVTFVALHSIADYPLKQPANALLFAALAGATLGAVGVPSRTRMGQRTQWLVVSLAVAAVLLVPFYFGLARSGAMRSAALDADSPATSLNAYSEALASDPSNIELRQATARAIVRAADEGDGANLRAAYLRALDVLSGGSPEDMIDARGLYLASVLMWRSGQLASADKAMRLASMLAPAYPSITRAAGTYFIRRLIESKGRHQEALDHAVDALAMANEAEVSSANLKGSFDLLEQVPGGPARLSDVTPDEHWAVTSLAQHHYRAGRPERARDALEKYSREHEGALSASTLALLADLRDRCGDVEGATDARVASLMVTPPAQRSSAAARIVAGLWDKSKQTEAGAFVQALKRQHSGESPALRAEGELALRSKDYQKAYQLLKESVDLSGNPDDHYRLAEVALKLRRDAEAEHHLTLAIAADPTKYYFWNMRASIRIKAGAVPLAIQDLQAALDAAPRNMGIRLRLSTLLLKANRVVELVETWRAAERDAPDDPVVLEQLARALFAACDFDKAVARARRSYEIAPERKSIRAFLKERDPDGPIADTPSP